MSDLLRPRGRRTNHKKGIAAEYKAKKRADAEKRQAAYDKLTKVQKIVKLNMGGYRAVRQRVRLDGIT